MPHLELRFVTASLCGLLASGGWLAPAQAAGRAPSPEQQLQHLVQKRDHIARFGVRTGPYRLMGTPKGNSVVVKRKPESEAAASRRHRQLAEQADKRAAAYRRGVTQGDLKRWRAQGLDPRAESRRVEGQAGIGQPPPGLSLKQALEAKTQFRRDAREKVHQLKVLDESIANMTFVVSWNRNPPNGKRIVSGDDGKSYQAARRYLQSQADARMRQQIWESLPKRLVVRSTTKRVQGLPMDSGLDKVTKWAVDKVNSWYAATGKAYDWEQPTIEGERLEVKSMSKPDGLGTPHRRGGGFTIAPDVAQISLTIKGNPKAYLVVDKSSTLVKTSASFIPVRNFYFYVRNGEVWVNHQQWRDEYGHRVQKVNQWHALGRAPEHLTQWLAQNPQPARVPAGTTPRWISLDSSITQVQAEIAPEALDLRMGRP